MWNRAIGISVQGPDGIQGIKGDTGDAGNPVSDIIQYQCRW